MRVDNELAAIEAALAGDRSDPELALLVSEARATAPRMTPAFERRLDDAVNAGFAKADPPRRRRRLRVGPALGLAGATVMAVAIGITVIPGGKTNTAPHETLATPNAASGSSASGGAAGSSSLPSRSTAVPEATDKAAAPPSHGEPNVPAATAAPVRRVQERAAELTLSTPSSHLQRTADSVVAVADRMGGYVQTSNVSSRAHAGEASFDLRIPTARLDDALAALSRLGHVRTRSQQAQDITASYTSARSRLHDAQAERQGLLKALAAASTTQQIESIKSRLRLVRSRIVEAQSALDSVRHRASYSRVSVTLFGDAHAAATHHHGGSSWTPGRALHDAGRLLSVAAGVAIVAAAAAVPAALLALLALIGVRTARRRRRESALDGAAAAV